MSKGGQYGDGWEQLMLLCVETDKKMLHNSWHASQYSVNIHTA